MADAATPSGLLVVREGSRTVILVAAEIVWIEAAANYARIHSGGETIVIRETIQRLLARLDPTRFVRIHRSRIVNTERVREVMSGGAGPREVVLHDGTRIRASRDGRLRLMERFTKTG